MNAAFHRRSLLSLGFRLRSMYGAEIQSNKHTCCTNRGRRAPQAKQVAIGLRWVCARMASNVIRQARAGRVHDCGLAPPCDQIGSTKGSERLSQTHHTEIDTVDCAREPLDPQLAKVLTPAAICTRTITYTIQLSASSALRLASAYPAKQEGASATVSI